jgi:hypothetical protein
MICLAQRDDLLVGVCISVDASKLEKQMGVEKTAHYFCELGILPSERRQGIATQLILLTEREVLTCSSYVADVKVGSNSHRLFSHLGYSMRYHNDVVRCTKPLKNTNIISMIPVIPRNKN